MRKVLDEHMIEVNDNGFIPEGLPVEGYEPSRDKAAYPLPRLMALAAKACARDPGARRRVEHAPGRRQPHRPSLGRAGIADARAPARRRRKDRLVAMMQADAVTQNRVVAAEAVAAIAPSPDAIAALAAIVDGTAPPIVKLQALNALTFLGDQAKAVLPTIKRAATVAETEYTKNAARYLEAVLEGRYEPGYPVFEMAGMERRRI